MPITPWVICPECEEEYYCQIHNCHVGDCGCPGIEWWAERDLDPYDLVEESIVQELISYQPEQEIGKGI